MKRAQISAEFLMFVSMAFILAIAITFVAAKQSIEFRKQKETEIIMGIAHKIQREFLIASTAEDGYVREFELPNEVNNFEYNLSQLNSTITLTSRKRMYFVQLPKYEGNISFGRNIINKTEGVIRVR